MQEKEKLSHQSFYEKPSSVYDRTSVSKTDEGWGYLGVGVNHVLMPSVGLGWRNQAGSHAFDLYGSFSSVLFINAVEFHFSYLYGKNFYFGPGIGIGYLEGTLGFSSDSALCGIGKGIVGKKLSEQSFLQLEANVITKDQKPVVFPSLSLRFGHGF